MGKIVSRAFQVRAEYMQRHNQRITIREVASAAGVTRAALSKLEAGKTEGIAFETLARLCAFYGVQPGDLLGYEERRTPAPATGWTPPQALGMGT